MTKPTTIKSKMDAIFNQIAQLRRVINIATSVPLPGSWGTEVQMVISGRLLLDAVNEYALLCGIDPRTGNRAA